MQPLLTGSHHGESVLSSSLKSLVAGDNVNNETWSYAAQGLVKAADVGRNTCVQMRQDVSKVDHQLQRSVKEKAGQVEGSLKMKMMTTKGLQDSIRRQLMAIAGSTDSLQHAIEKSEEAVISLQKPLKGTASRQHLRGTRNEREGYFEVIDQHLIDEVQLLKTGVDNLQNLLSRGKTTLEELFCVTQILEADLEDKNKAYELDLKCLTTNPTQTATLPIEKKELNKAVNGGAMSTKSVFLPSIWKHSTEASLGKAVQVDAAAKQLTKLILTTISDINRNHEENRHKTFTAFRSKVKQATVLRQQISGRISVLTNELENLTVQRDQLRKSLEDKQAPLSVLQQRVAVRKLRPAREAVHDEVEQAMQSELQELLKSVNVLNDKVDSIESEMRKLKANKKFLSVDLRDKDRTLRVDKKCLDLVDGVTTPASSNPGTPLSSLTSASNHASRNHQYALHIINSLKPKLPKPPDIQKLARMGKRQYPKPSRSMTVGTG
eukprot:TRINITY_DN12960_c0_g1_i1.p1 TRINITY_DN12960_c0_g1~~TRINITY_DN12960_c0_g1_i1.p1  ORF type:complete len:505 (+),score=81.12 TRINITY_DN12960_c0_g1_i1:42-1517(+)